MEVNIIQTPIIDFIYLMTYNNELTRPFGKVDALYYQWYVDYVHNSKHKILKQSPYCITLRTNIDFELYVVGHDGIISERPTLCVV